MRLKFAFLMAALFCFAALPALAQHGHSGSSSHGVSGGHGNSSSGHSEAGEHGGDKHGDSGKHGDDDANEHSGKHDGSHGHKSAAAALAQNPKLAAKLQSLLPPGTDLQAAAQGFKNLGQFVAALHVSKDLGIPFDQLKAKLTGPGAESLGKAIHDLKPDASVKTALKQAEKEAHADLESTEKDKGAEHDHDADHSHDSDDNKKGS
jgi:hypothetical protein